MRWSWKIGTFLGIDVYIHTTFLLLIGFVIVSHWLRDQSLGSVIASLAFITALFICVLLHEYGHSLTARRFGIKTRDITLLPIGGVARLERMPEDPKQELWVALMGPVVNAVIAAILFVSLWVTNSLEPLERLSVTDGPFLERLLAVNVSLVLFNLLPAFPMDGGRALRALLAMRMDYTRATQIAAVLGQGIAFVLGFIGLFTNPFLLFIAFFVWIGAAQEAGASQVKTVLSGIPVSRAMLTDFQSLARNHTLGKAIELVIAGSQKDFPVVDNGRVVGVLTASDLFTTLAQRGKDVYVAEIMRKDFETVDSMEMLETAAMRMQENRLHTMPVMHDGQLVGLLTMENVGEFLMIQSALGLAKQRAF